MFNQFQKVALVTGSAQRIGKYIIERLANEGWEIALHYNLAENEAYELANKLLEITNVMIFKADLTKLDEADRLFNSVVEKLGNVSLLINNASIYKNDNLDNLNVTDLQQCLNIHLNSPLLLSKAMGKQNVEANIINILDTEVTENMKKFFSYSLAKKNLLNLTQMLAVNLAPNIKVNAIAPGPTLFKEGQNKQVFDSLIEESPLKQQLSLDELYNTIDFLIKSKSITGQVIFLDGGKHLI